MVEQLLLHIQRHQLCKTSDKILLGVSGGIDSMVMLDLFRKAQFSIGVVHCNFQLRGPDSDADEAFVRAVCSAAEIPLFAKRFNTEEYAKQNDLSIQLAARQLRYSFFEQVANEHGYVHIATAHHLNDAIETVLLNLTRGTGIQGLSGIPVKNGRIVRPLLFATRTQIHEYAGHNGIAWREDKSNDGDDYQRNFVRHKITPLLATLNPNFENTFQKTIERISGAAELTQEYLEHFSATFIKTKEDRTWIAIGEVKKHHHAEVLLWELLKSNGFNFEQCADIVTTQQPGKQFLTSTHRLLVDREFYILTERHQTEILEVLIEADQERATNGRIELRLAKHTSTFTNLSHDSSIAQLDCSTLTFPLRWRRWHAGDTFRPLGMDGHKKISDFLIDQKVSVAEKNSVTVVESGGMIVWVVGMRISDEVKITPSTTVFVEMKVVKSEDEKFHKVIPYSLTWRPVLRSGIQYVLPK